MLLLDQARGDGECASGPFGRLTPTVLRTHESEHGEERDGADEGGRGLAVDQGQGVVEVGVVAED